MNNIQNQIKQIEENIEESAEDTRSSKGFMTKKGQYLDRAEWHASVIGFAPIGTGFLLPTPLGELFIISQLGLLRTGMKKKLSDHEISGHIGDVIEEIAYTYASAFLATLVFVALSFHFNFIQITSIDFSQLLIAMLGGA